MLGRMSADEVSGRMAADEVPGRMCADEVLGSMAVDVVKNGEIVADSKCRRCLQVCAGVLVNQDKDNTINKIYH